MMEKILIDSGPSKKGWSYYSTAFRCLHLHALKRSGLINESRDPMTRGSMFHVGVAHLHTQQMCRQTGNDPSLFYNPEQAIEEWAKRHQEGLPQIDRVIETYRRYVAVYPEPPGKRIVGVECELAGVLGWKGGEWGLWAVSPSEVESPSPTWVQGGVITPSVIECPGHPDNGKNIYLTRKLDLVIEDLRGNIYIEDYKCKAVEVYDSTARKYAMSGEFAVTRILSKQVWPRYAGVALWMVQSAAPWKVAKPAVPESPWRDSTFPRDLHRMAHTLAFLERDTPDPHLWPMAQNEVSCVGRYEKDGCPAMGFCMNGRMG